MYTEQKRQTTLSVSYSSLPLWHHRVQEMQKCRTLDALITLHGPPNYKTQKPNEIWHYFLGIESGMTYSIHVSIRQDEPQGVFLHSEPVRTIQPL